MVTVASTEKPLSKTAKLRAERTARRQSRIEARMREAVRLSDLRARAAVAVKSLPVEFQSWGSVRTRAWFRLAEILAYRVGLKTVTADELESYLAAFLAVPGMAPSECQSYVDADIKRRLFDGA